MFDSTAARLASLRAWTDQLRTAHEGLDDAGRIDMLRALEELACAARAAQAMVTVDFDESQRAAQAAAGVPQRRRGSDVAGQVALARRESPHRGRQHLGLAKALRDEMPDTMEAFRDGRITEHKATLLVRETACLSREDRRTVDARLAGNADALERMGDQELAGAAAKLAYQLDPEAIVERRRRAETDRRVTLRPAPDVMSQLSALLPMKQGVSVYAALTREADRLRAAGDERSRGQIMADALVSRVVGGAADGGAAAPDPHVMINLVVSDDVLLGASNEPAHVTGYGPVPADLARSLASSARVWLRRLYSSSATGSLVAMDSRARCVPTAIAALIRARDQRCRTPWCDAPVRQVDHVKTVDEGGGTTVPNLQGLCEACNHTKQSPGWRQRPRPGPRHVVETTTPTGHTYRSTSPPLRHPSFVEVGPGHWARVA
ncbi:DUF222 domain-containing protein [Nocardioides sp. KIGAM211]|uniref:DUF222 domain-containing protein n=1 Tax=Nocardioides luti TaxID=2761101 RepID=A0A7X0RFW1_9ACTN|nr:HNH endonuclease signature motif containing protein [Nocardioides luti]MBB6626269.1 DUF222 domain-containing protein [Nocardioides luti]